jgi:oligoendopeptidase F
MSEAQQKTIPTREEIDPRDTWDLSHLFYDDEAWEEGLRQFKEKMQEIPRFKGQLGESEQHLRECLDFMMELGKLEERLGSYAHLRLSEDGGDSSNQDRIARYIQAASQAEALASYQIPEIQRIPDTLMEVWLETDTLREYRIYLEKILRFKPHILSEEEERLLALQTEPNQTASNTFSALTNVDMDFGEVETEEGKKPLTQSTFSSFMLNPDKQIRKHAYTQFYTVFESHKNTLASLYNGSVQLDIYKSRVRNYPSSRAAALFPDKIPENVYDNLISAVHDHLESLHHYYRMRKQALGLDTLNHYDVYVPLVKDIRVHHTYEEAVEVVIRALQPLGTEYCSILREGLHGRWVDRYENKGKRSGAFSAGSYTGQPYILMNFKEDVLRDVFTLAHEGGHSMHSWYSVHNNPFQHYDYTIFEAEVASTFNEQLLAQHLFENAETREMQAYLLGKQIDDIIATIFRQTMFAEFEHRVHSMVENGQALTVDSLRNTYRELLETYFGDEMELEAFSDMEGLRIPHFYRSFYVYKYATGLSAAISLAERVLQGGEQEREQYIAFLKSGGSRYPLESLELAGVDMQKREPIDNALGQFTSMVERLEHYLLS